jgi:mRNA interferase MazF
MTSLPKPSRAKVQEHRKRLRSQGLRPIQIWVPDVRAPAFRSEARRQARAVAASRSARGSGVHRCCVGVGRSRRMRRGDIWTVAGGQGYAGKPRPVVIVQDDSFNATDSITICAFTSDETDAPLFRLPVDPSPRNGLRITCRMMVDKITTVPKSKVGVRVGRLSDEGILRLNRSLAVFLGLASSSRTSRQSRTAPRTRSGRG